VGDILPPITVRKANPKWGATSTKSVSAIMTITRIVLTNLVGFAAANFLLVANIRDFKLNNFFENIRSSDTLFLPNYS
jgi:hypothetical protein